MSPGSLALSLLFCSSLGCASTYVPRTSSRVSLVIDGGTYAYVRDGKRYNGGILGPGIEEAVQGNRQAEEYAQKYKTGMATGLVMTLVGAATGIIGLVVFTADAAHTSFNQPVAPTGLIVLGSGVVVELIGTIISLNAQPHLFDAINAYNDGLLEPSNERPAP